MSWELFPVSGRIFVCVTINFVQKKKKKWELETQRERRGKKREKKVIFMCLTCQEGNTALVTTPFCAGRHGITGYFCYISLAENGIWDWLHALLLTLTVMTVIIAKMACWKSWSSFFCEKRQSNGVVSETWKHDDDDDDGNNDDDGDMVGWENKLREMLKQSSFSGKDNNNNVITVKCRVLLVCLQFWSGMREWCYFLREKKCPPFSSHVELHFL